jgi:hypothetical protein
MWLQLSDKKETHVKSFGPHTIGHYLHNFSICRDVCWWNQVPIHLDEFLVLSSLAEVPIYN